jgi:hypothetical protein
MIDRFSQSYVDYLDDENGDTFSSDELMRERWARDGSHDDTNHDY